MPAVNINTNFPPFPRCDWHSRNSYRPRCPAPDGGVTPVTPYGWGHGQNSVNRTGIWGGKWEEAVTQRKRKDTMTEPLHR